MLVPSLTLNVQINGGAIPPHTRCGMLFQDPSGREAEHGAVVDNNGHATFIGIPNGPCLVLAETPGQNQVACKLVQIKGDENVELHLQSTVSVAVTVIGNPIAKTSRLLFVDAANTNLLMGQIRDGSGDVKLIPGTYDIYVMLGKENNFLAQAKWQFKGDKGTTLNLNVASPKPVSMSRILADVLRPHGGRNLPPP